jgi:putative two-component system response regulator
MAYNASMHEPTRLLIIDDDKALLVGLVETIKREGTYQVLAADNGNLGIKLAKENLPHLIICDLMMPPPDGMAVLKALSEDIATLAIPFIFLTARTDERDKIIGMNLGADDFITKPFSKEDLMARIGAILRRKKITETRQKFTNEEEVSALSIKVHELLQRFSTDQDGLAEAMAQMLALRDNETAEHARRVVELSDRLARELELEESICHHIHLGALLHDIGKVGVPDSILLNTGPLTDEERIIMMNHPSIGKKIIQPLGLPPTVIDLVHHHHERWDGNGYPSRLSGKKIPLVARIFAIVDVWDALTTDRTYRKAWSKEKTINYISEQAGKHFDPDIVEKFLIVIQHESKGK